MEKFGKVNEGMPYDEVKNIIDGNGTLLAKSIVGNQSMKIYYWCVKKGVLDSTFNFTNDILSTKSRIGLE